MELSERRRLLDRRRHPTPMLSRYSLFRGRRREIRRQEEAAYTYVDQIGAGVGFALLSIFLFHCLDGILTLAHIQRGGSELNPLMRYLLEHGDGPFLGVKLCLAGVGLLFLGVHKNFPMVKGAIGVLLVIFGLLVGYHFLLIALSS